MVQKNIRNALWTIFIFQILNLESSSEDIAESTALTVGNFAQEAKKSFDEIQMFIQKLEEKVTESKKNLSPNMLSQVKLSFLTLKNKFLLEAQKHLNAADTAAKQAIILPEQIKRNEHDFRKKAELEDTLDEKLRDAENASKKAAKLLDDCKNEITIFEEALASQIKPATDSNSSGQLVPLSQAQGALRSKDMTGFASGMKRSMGFLMKGYQGVVTNMLVNPSNIQAGQGQPSVVRNFLSMTNQAARDFRDMVIAVDSLSSAQKKDAVPELVRANMVLALTTFQTGIFGARLQAGSYDSKNFITSFYWSTPKTTAPSVASTLAVVGTTQGQLSRKLSPSQRLTAIAESFRPLFIDPKYMPLFYKTLALDTNEYGEELNGIAPGLSEIIPLTSVQIVMHPATVSDQLIDLACNVLALSFDGNNKDAATKTDELIAQASQVTLRTGELDEVAAISHADFLYKLSLLLTTYFGSDVLAALGTIGKTFDDLNKPDFDTKTLVLYQKSHPNEFKVLKNRRIAIEMVFRILQAYFNLLQQLVDNFDQLQPESKQLVLRLAIETQQNQIFDSSPALLGSLPSASSFAQIKQKEQKLLTDIEKLTSGKSDSSRASKSLTQDFMDQVSQESSGWFNKLSKTTGMITFTDVAKVVVNQNYDNNQILYIQGYLQARAGF